MPDIFIRVINSTGQFQARPGVEVDVFGGYWSHGCGHLDSLRYPILAREFRLCKIIEFRQPISKWIYNTSIGKRPRLCNCVCTDLRLPDTIWLKLWGRRTTIVGSTHTLHTAITKGDFLGSEVRSLVLKWRVGQNRTARFDASAPRSAKIEHPSPSPPKRRQ